MAYKQRWLEYFDILDADGSGFLDPNDINGATKDDKQYYARIMHEPETSPHVQAVVATQAAFLQLLIKEYDSSKDGKVSREEFLTAVEKVLCSGSVPDWWKMSIDQAFESGDRQHNEYISLEEMVQSIQLINPKESPENIKKAYDWAASESGKYDKAAHFRVSFTWATSPDPTPEATTLTPYFRRITVD